MTVQHISFPCPKCGKSLWSGPDCIACGYTVSEQEMQQVEKLKE